MPLELVLLILVIMAGGYMAWNIGANDVANAMGTSVGSGALRLKQAIYIAAVLEFSGAFFFGSHVSETIQSGIIDASMFSKPIVIVYGMLASLLAAGLWLQIASYYGWPVSTTHSIVGAIVGFGAAVGGLNAVHWENVFYIVTSWVLSPILGAILSYGIFSYLRRQIFYVSDPIAAAKRITPYFIFYVIFILALIMLYKGLSNVDLKLSFSTSLGISILCGVVAALASKFFLRKVHLGQFQNAENEYHPQISDQLEKAAKLMLQVKTVTQGAAQYQALEILEEIKMLSTSLKKKEATGRQSAEYAFVEKIFGYLQILSACLMAFAHGANDVANAIGPLSAALSILQTGVIAAQTAVPIWALGLGGVGIIVGLATWGWRVIETIGKKITELTPTRGFSAEFGASLTILLASRLGLPISTTHTLVGSVIGIGLARGIEALDLRTVRHIVISWLVTVPAGALIAIVFFYIINGIFSV